MRRRALLGAAAGALTAVLAACGRPEGETTFRPARTATPQGGTASRIAIASATREPTVTPGPAIGTVIPTPRQGAAIPDLLRMLGFIPNAQDASGGVLAFLSRWKGSFSFANLGAVKKLYGYDTIRAFADLSTRNISATDYANVTGGCYLTEFTGLQYSQSQYRDAFGYDVFQVDREISAGQPPDAFSRMEGAFDADAIIAMLQRGGYAAADHRGIPYYTVRGDGELAVSDPRGRLGLGRMNRIAVNKDRITAAPKTELIAAALDTELKMTAALDVSVTVRALATALSNVTSMVTIPPGTSDVVEAVLQPGQLAATTRDWGTLHPSELNAIGYTDAGNFQRTVHVALVYTNPADAAADERELVKRITSYLLIRTQQTLVPTYATGVTSRTATVSGKGILIADIALLAQPALGKLWIDMYQSRDTLFLVPQPVSATASPPPITPAPGGSARPATPRASSTP